MGHEGLTSLKYLCFVHLLVPTLNEELAASESWDEVDAFNSPNGKPSYSIKTVEEDTLPSIQQQPIKGMYCVSCSVLREGIQAIIFAIFFGILLPYTDTGTDLRLSFQLFISGHPRWAFLTIAPVLLNTVFTLVLCRGIEKKQLLEKKEVGGW